MKMTPAEREQELVAFRETLTGLSDSEFVDKVEHYVWLSAYAANNGRSIYHEKCDATHDEAKRRGKPWLYQRGWNAAFESCGHTLSDADIAAASEPASVDGRRMAETRSGSVRSTTSAVRDSGDAQTPSSTGAGQ